ncbi:MAG: hypothetical protein ABW128_01475 [Rhizorhabdus sp.]
MLDRAPRPLGGFLQETHLTCRKPMDRAEVNEKYGAQYACLKQRHGKGRAYAKSCMRQLVRLVDRRRIGDVVICYDLSGAKPFQQTSAEILKVVPTRDAGYTDRIVLLDDYIPIGTRLLSEADAIGTEFLTQNARGHLFDAISIVERPERVAQPQQEGKPYFTVGGRRGPGRTVSHIRCLCRDRTSAWRRISVLLT